MKRISVSLIIAIALFVPCAPAWAAIAFDAASSTCSGSPCSHTVASDANLLVVTLSCMDSSGADCTMTNVKWNTTEALTDAHSGLCTATGQIGSWDPRTDIWYLASPTTGTLNLTWSWSGGNPSGKRVQVMSFKGTDTSSPVGTTVCGSQTSGTSIQNSHSGMASDAWIVAAGSSETSSADTVDADTGTTETYDTHTGANAQAFGGYDGDESGTTIGWSELENQATSLLSVPIHADTSVDYVVAEGRFTLGGGSASSTNYEVTETSFEVFGGGALTSTNYALETKIGVAGMTDVAIINSVSPADFAKLYFDESAEYTVGAVSQDGDTLQYRARQDATVKDGPQASNVLTWTLSASDVGRHTVTVEVIDPQGTTIKKQSAYVVRRPAK